MFSRGTQTQVPLMTQNQPFFSSKRTDVPLFSEIRGDFRRKK